MNYPECILLATNTVSEKKEHFKFTSSKAKEPVYICTHKDTKKVEHTITKQQNTKA